MNTYLIVKTLHILSATLMVGTGFGTAFYLFWANRSGSVPAQAVVSKWVIKADWWFTTPAVIFQPLSGWCQLILRHKMDSLDHWPVYLERHLLAARGLAANPSSENGAGRTRNGRKQPSAKILALCADLGTVGLSRFLRHGRHLLPDGAQTRLRPSETRL